MTLLSNENTNFGVRSERKSQKTVGFGKYDNVQTLTSDIFRLKSVLTHVLKKCSYKLGHFWY